jgi:hypothetical protein
MELRVFLFVSLRVLVLGDFVLVIVNCSLESVIIGAKLLEVDSLHVNFLACHSLLAQDLCSVDERAFIDVVNVHLDLAHSLHACHCDLVYLNLNV